MQEADDGTDFFPKQVNAYHLTGARPFLLTHISSLSHLVR